MAPDPLIKALSSGQSLFRAFLTTMFAGKDLSRTHVSMVCNAGAPAMVAFYLVAAGRMGVPKELVTKLGDRIVPVPCDVHQPAAARAAGSPWLTP